MNNPIDYSPFEGDGRVKVVHELALPGTLPIQVTNAQARRVIDSFLASGHSTHSGNGSTLWVLLEWCQHHKVPYTLKAYPGEGYYVAKGEPL